jgi:hypothetical protein
MRLLRYARNDRVGVIARSEATKQSRRKPRCFAQCILPAPVPPVQMSKDEAAPRHGSSYSHIVDNFYLR